MKHRFPEPRYVEFSVRFLLVGFLGNIVWNLVGLSGKCGFWVDFPIFFVGLVFLDVFLFGDFSLRFG